MSLLATVLEATPEHWPTPEHWMCSLQHQKSHKTTPSSAKGASQRPKLSGSTPTTLIQTNKPPKLAWVRFSGLGGLQPGCNQDFTMVIYGNNDKTQAEARIEIEFRNQTFRIVQLYVLINDGNFVLRLNLLYCTFWGFFHIICIISALDPGETRRL